MDVGRSGPGPLDGSLLTLQSVHRSQVVWNNIEIEDKLWGVLEESSSPQTASDDHGCNQGVRI
ncbi:hypothetical protein ACET3Z_005063 [Daucus carota]